MHFKLIVACDTKNGIGKDNDIPWKLTKELKYFKQITTHSNNQLLKNVVIMGRKTWESIPIKYKPLPNRINIVLTSKAENFTNTNDLFYSKSITDCIELIKTIENVNMDNIFVIGGGTIYKTFLENYAIQKIYLTEVYQNFDCDTYFPEIPDKFKLGTVSKFIEDNGIYYRNIVYYNATNFMYDTFWKNNEEQQYLDCMKRILKTGCEKLDRTNVGIFYTFGEMFKYDLSDTFPALTTRRQFLRGIFEELQFYISGKTDNKNLNDKNVNIWNGNTTREFLDSRGLTHYPEGDMGETYGFNFRHYGAEYKTCKEDYSGQGFDQIEYILNLIKTDPTSRRIIIDIWNGSTINKSALPPCLCKYQFNVNIETKTLDLMIYLRSSDFFLANNWNVCTGAFFVHMICNLKDIDLTPGILTVVTGDTHIYKTHLEQATLNLERIPRPFPKLVIKNKKEKLEDFKFEDMKILGYKPYKSISADMAV